MCCKMSVRSHRESLSKQYAAQCLQQICWLEISSVSLCNETLETCNRKLNCNTVKFTVFKSGVQNKSMPLIVDKYQHVTFFPCLLHMLGSQSPQEQNACFVFFTSRVSRKIPAESSDLKQRSYGLLR